MYNVDTVACLRSRDVNINHYQGSVSNMGRALAESAQQDEVINLLLVMIADKRLDLFNRVTMGDSFEIQELC